MKVTKKLSVIRLVVVLVLGLFTHIVSAQDPGATGPFNVSTTEYNHGDTAFTPSGFPGAVEVRGYVHYPTNLSQGNFPLVIFMHGRHSTCYDEDIQDDGAGGDIVTYDTYLQWPCTSGRTTLPNHRGYDYIASALASHGYIVVSIGANGINARDNSTADAGMDARARLIQHHLSIWQDFNTSSAGDFGSLFVGKIDLNNIGTMGHSRGGEGVAKHFVYNKSLGSPYGVKAILPLAPTDFNRPLVDEVPLGVVLPYCDGDVSDLQGVHFYDDARYSSSNDSSPKHTFLVMGANHNYFNTKWTPGLFPPVQPDNETTVVGSAGALDDWSLLQSSVDPYCGNVSGNQRISASEQRDVAREYISAFFRTYLGGETEFDSLLKGDSQPTNLSSEVHVSYHAPSSERLDINRLDIEGRETTNTVGGSASQSGMSIYDICGDDASEEHCLASQISNRQPHTTSSVLSSKLGLSQLKLNWNNTTDSYTNTFPSNQSDISAYEYIQFRAGVNFVDNPQGVDQDFEVQLIDGNGSVSSVNVADVSGALFDPPGSYGAVPKLFLNTVRIPLVLYGDIDMTDISQIQFRFSETNQGAILVSDLALVGVSEVQDPIEIIENPYLNFSNQFEFWENTGDIDWQITSGGTPSSSTGPTSGSGNYAYFETSSGSAYYAGDTASLTSPYFESNRDDMSFMYHMYGANIGTLRVYIYDNNRWNLIETITGQQQSSQSAGWEEYNYGDMEQYHDRPIRVRIEAIAAGGWQGDIAIDSIIINDFRSSPLSPSLIGVRSDGSGSNENTDGSDYSDYTLEWRDASYATYYQMRVDNGSITSLGYVHSLTVDLNVGETDIDVRACNEGGCSEWAEVVVSYFPED